LTTSLGRPVADTYTSLRAAEPATDLARRFVAAQRQPMVPFHSLLAHRPVAVEALLRHSRARF
jgi:hypothetical protein